MKDIIEGVGMMMYTFAFFLTVMFYNGSLREGVLLFILGCLHCVLINRIIKQLPRAKES